MAREAPEAPEAPWRHPDSRHGPLGTGAQPAPFPRTPPARVPCRRRRSTAVVGRRPAAPSETAGTMDPFASNPGSPALGGEMSLEIPHHHPFVRCPVLNEKYEKIAVVGKGAFGYDSPVPCQPPHRVLLVAARLLRSVAVVMPPFTALRGRQPPSRGELTGAAPVAHPATSGSVVIARRGPLLR